MASWLLAGRFGIFLVGTDVDVWGLSDHVLAGLLISILGWRLLLTLEGWQPHADLGLVPAIILGFRGTVEPQYFALLLQASSHGLRPALADECAPRGRRYLVLRSQAFRFHSRSSSLLISQCVGACGVDGTDRMLLSILQLVIRLELKRSLRHDQVESLRLFRQQ